MKILNRNLITVYATQEFLEWVKSVKPSLHLWGLDDINGRPAAFLIDIEDQNLEGSIIQERFRDICETILTGQLYIGKEKWPDEIPYELFQRWFRCQYHESIYDLSLDELRGSEDY